VYAFTCLALLTPTYIQKQTDTVLPPIQNNVGISKIIILILYQVWSRLVIVKFTYTSIEVSDLFLMQFELFMVVKIHAVILWIVTPCNDVIGYQHFGGPCFLHLIQSEDRVA